VPRSRRARSKNDRASRDDILQMPADTHFRTDLIRVHRLVRTPFFASRACHRHMTVSKSQLLLLRLIAPCHLLVQCQISLLVTRLMP